MVVIDCGCGESKCGVAEAEAEREERRVFVEDIAAAGGGRFVIVDRKLADVACDSDGKMAGRIYVAK